MPPEVDNPFSPPSYSSVGPPSYDEKYAAQSPPFNPNSELVLKNAPPLDLAWLVHEGTLPPKVPVTDFVLRQQTYAAECRARNALFLAGQDADLRVGISILDTVIAEDVCLSSHQIPLGTQNSRRDIPIRSYNPFISPTLSPNPSTSQSKGRVSDGRGEEERDVVIYYHGGGLYVGDLDSEDLTCRRLCLALSCTVYSVDYRLMPQHTADQALDDAIMAFRYISSLRRGRIVLCGSSSGSMLAAMVAQHGRRTLTLPSGRQEARLIGLALRGPVLCDATSEGLNLPPRFREAHTSMSATFYTSLLAGPALTPSNRPLRKLPLEADSFEELPRCYLQICTNDVYYSDGVVYGEALREVGRDVRIDVVRGWPHTFWLKAPELERAREAERECVEGVRWLFDSDSGEEEKAFNAE